MKPPFKLISVLLFSFLFHTCSNTTPTAGQSNSDQQESSAEGSSGSDYSSNSVLNLTGKKVTLTKSMIAASEELYDSILNKFSSEEDILIGEYLSASARIAGTCMFQTFDLNVQGVEPGTFMLSQEANTAFMDLSNILNSTLLSKGIRIGNNYLDAPENLNPQLTMTQFFSEFMATVSQIKKKHDLSFLEFACVSTITSASFIDKFKDSIDPRMSTGLAVYGFIEGTKTVPPAFPD